MGRGQKQACKADSDSGKAARPRAGESQIHHVPIGSRRPGKWGDFPRELNKAAAGSRPGHSWTQLTAPQAVSTPSPNTHRCSYAWDSIISKLLSSPR